MITAQTVRKNSLDAPNAKDPSTEYSSIAVKISNIKRNGWNFVAADDIIYILDRILFPREKTMDYCGG